MQDIIKDKVKEFLKIEETTADEIFEQLTLFIYSLESKKHDLYILAKLLKPEELSKVISYFDGDTLKLPSKEEHRNLLLLSVCYYLKSVKGWDWTKIKEFLDLPENNQNLLSSISIGGRINKLNEQMSKELLKILNTTEIKGMEEFVSKELRGNN